MTSTRATVAFLACETTLPGSGERRGDAYEHDLITSALEPAFAAEGLAMPVINWEAEISEFKGVDAVLLGTSWNYQDKPDAFLARLEELEGMGIQVFNPPSVVRWNSRKTYLEDLAKAGAHTVPTIWLDDAETPDLVAAMDTFATDTIVVKRQIGAGALDQELHRKGALPDANWNYGHRAMLQPFLPSIQTEGEFSFVFIDGELSHALQKRAAEGDYRIQSLYGGFESDYTPSEAEIAQAAAIIDKLPFEPPIYARVDMVRGFNGELLLMEAEMVEPYLYPEQGPDLGQRLAKAVANRVYKR